MPIRILLLLVLIWEPQVRIPGPGGESPVSGGGPPPGITRVGSVAVGWNTSGGSSSSIATSTASITLVAGNAVVICGRLSTTGETLTYSDSTGLNSYTPLTPVSDGNSTLGCGYALNVSAGTNVTFAASWGTGSPYLGVVAHQYSGVLTVSALDIGATASGGSSTTQTITGLTSVQANEVVMMFDSLETLPVTYTAGTLNGVAMNIGGTGGALFASEDLVVSTSLSSVSATMTTNISASWEMAAVSLK
jgi:hypothetical protein